MTPVHVIAAAVAASLVAFSLRRLLFVCAASAVDLSIRQEGDCIHVSTTNNTFWYCRFEWSNTLLTNDWHHYRTLFGNPDEPASYAISFTVKTNQPRTFWRLRDAPLP